MEAAEPLVPLETEPLTWDEICARFPDQYVCLVDLVKLEPGNPDFKTARVVGCGSTRNDASAPIRGVPRNKYPRHAVRYTGEPGPLIRPALVIDDETLAILLESMPLTHPALTTRTRYQCRGSSKAAARRS